MGGGHKAPRKAPQTLQEEAGQHTKDENTDKRFRDGDLSLARELRRRIFHIVGNSLTGRSAGSSRISESSITGRKKTPEYTPNHKCRKENFPVKGSNLTT